MPIKQINQITSLKQLCDGDNFVVAIETALPSTPTFFSTCLPVQNFLLEKDRQGTVVPHGIKKWIPQLKQQLAPSICQGNQAIFTGAYGCGGSGSCSWFIAELGATPPTIQWDSLLHSCSCGEPPDALALGIYLPAAISVNGNWQQYGFLKQTPQSTLPYNGATVILPSHGSFGASAGSIWLPSAPGIGVQTRIVVTGSPNSPFTSPPSGGDPRPCAGNVVNVPRQRITGPGWTVHAEAMAPFHFGVFAFTQPPGHFHVDWYDD
jgi:hypothetical protein